MSATPHLNASPVVIQPLPETRRMQEARGATFMGDEAAARDSVRQVRNKAAHLAAAALFTKASAFNPHDPNDPNWGWADRINDALAGSKPQPKPQPEPPARANAVPPGQPASSQPTAAPAPAATPAPTATTPQPTPLQSLWQGAKTVGSNMVDRAGQLAGAAKQKLQDVGSAAGGKLQDLFDSAGVQGTRAIDATGRAIGAVGRGVGSAAQTAAPHIGAAAGWLAGHAGRLGAAGGRKLVEHTGEAWRGENAARQKHVDRLAQDYVAQGYSSQDARDLADDAVNKPGFLRSFFGRGTSASQKEYKDALRSGQFSRPMAPHLKARFDMLQQAATDPRASVAQQDAAHSELNNLYGRFFGRAGQQAAQGTSGGYQAAVEAPAKDTAETGAADRKFQQSLPALMMMQSMLGGGGGGGGMSDLLRMHFMQQMMPNISEMMKKMYPVEKSPDKRIG